MLGHDYAGDVVVEIAGHAAGVKDENAGKDGNVKGTGLFHELGELVGVVDGLGLEELNAGLDLLAHAGDFKVDVGRAGVGGRSEAEAGNSIQVVSGEIFTRFHAGCGADEVNDAEIEDGLGVGVITCACGVTGEAEDVLNAQDVGC